VHEADSGISELGFQLADKHVEHLPMHDAQEMGHAYAGLKRRLQQQVLVLCFQEEREEGISDFVYLIYLLFHEIELQMLAPQAECCMPRSHSGRSQCPVPTPQPHAGPLNALMCAILCERGGPCVVEETISAATVAALYIEPHKLLHTRISLC
jgi:hypothetical protein